MQWLIHGTNVQNKRSVLKALKPLILLLNYTKLLYIRTCIFRILRGKSLLSEIKFTYYYTIKKLLSMCIHLSLQ